MPPKEKAIDIRFKCWKDADITPNQAKQSALIAVDELIKRLVELSNGEYTFIHKVQYWQEVKKEINKL